MELRRDKMNVGSVSSIMPAQSVQPAQKASDANNNNVTLNVVNNVKASGGTGGILLANIVDIQGSNNNITINEYNNIVIGYLDSPTPHGGITPTVNPDGSVKFTDADNLSATFQDYVKQLLQSVLLDLQAPTAAKAKSAYAQADNLTTPTPAPTTSTLL